MWTTQQIARVLAAGTHLELHWHLVRLPDRLRLGFNTPTYLRIAEAIGWWGPQPRAGSVQVMIARIVHLLDQPGLAGDTARHVASRAGSVVIPPRHYYVSGDPALPHYREGYGFPPDYRKEAVSEWLYQNADVAPAF